MNKDITLEEIALTSILQRGTIELFSEHHFTEERRYLFNLFERTLQRYNCLDGTFCEIVASEEHDSILLGVRQHYPELIAVPLYQFESFFINAFNPDNIIKHDAARILVPKLAALDKEREYAKAIADLYQRVCKKGEYTPLEDIIELERYTTSTDYSAKDFTERYDSYKNEEPVQIITTGETWLDDKASLIKGNLTVIGGDSGSLKTTTALWMIIKVLQANPTYKAVFFEKEMPIADIMSKIISFFTKVPTNEIIANKLIGTYAMDKFMSGEHPLSEKALDILRRLKLVGTNEFSTIEDMLNYIESEQADIWCLDFLTQMFEGASNPSSFNFEVMLGMNKMKRIVHRTGSTGIILCQLKKGTVEHRVFKVPMPDDLEWSGTIKQLANSIFMTFYPSMYYSNRLTTEENQYFYLCNVKNRFNSRYNIPFLAFPGTNTLKQPPDERVREWLNNHIDKMTKYS